MEPRCTGSTRKRKFCDRRSGEDSLITVAARLAPEKEPRLLSVSRGARRIALTGRRSALLRLLCGNPECVHLVEARVVHGTADRAQRRFDRCEKRRSNLAFVPRQRRLGVHVEVASKIGCREQKIADLVRDGLPDRQPSSASSISASSSFSLRNNQLRVIPVEADSRGLGLQLHGTGEGREVQG